MLLCSCEKQFNSLDIGGGYLLDADYGLALQYRDEAACLQYYNQYGSWLKTKITAANRSEEMRLLYVAMTRAREKLICVGSVENLKADWSGCIAGIPEKMHRRMERAFGCRNILPERSPTIWIG